MMIESYEINENGDIYIINKYKSGTVEKVLKCESIQVDEKQEEKNLSMEEVQSQILLNTEYLVTITQLNNI